MAIEFHTYWYEQPKDEVHAVLWPYLVYLENQNRSRLNECLRNHGLYGHRDVIGFQPYGYFRSAQSPYSNASNPILNICESMVDTAANRIAGSTQTAIEFVTTDGDYTQQRLAKQRTRYVDGMFYKHGVYDLGEEMVTDAGTYGEGYAKIFDRNGEPVIERVFPPQMLIDPLEAMYGAPRQMFEKRAISRAQAMKRWGNTKARKKIIEEAPPIKAVGKASSAAAPDMIAIGEAYYLPTGPEAGDGVRAVVTENGTLGVDEWKHDFFPYAVFKWKTRRLGYWGQSIISSVARIQGEINQYLRVISKSHYAMAVPRLWVQPGSNFNPDTFTRDIGSVVESSAEPRIIAQQILPAEVYQHLDRLISRAYQFIGISENAAAARKSPGVTSAIAINAEVDLQSDRLANPSKRYEGWFVEVAKQFVACIKDIAEKNDGSYKIRVKRGGRMFEMDWADHAQDIDEDALVMQAQPMSSLPRQIPGKLEYINNLLQMGTITRAQAVRMYSNPDVDALLDPQSAQEDLYEEQIEKILDHGLAAFEPPEPTDNLDLAQTMYLNAYNKARRDGAPDDVLDALRQYIMQIKVLMPPPETAPALPGLPGSNGQQPGPVRPAPGAQPPMLQ